MCRLIFLAEKIFRKVQIEQCVLLDRKNAIDLLVYFTMEEISDMIENKNRNPEIGIDTDKDNFFLELQSTKHYITSSFGDSPDNHMFSFMRIILKKFFAMRIKKAKKDQLLSGNYIQRTRIFTGV